MVIPTVTFCTFIPNEESNIEHFHSIKSSFNQNKFEYIYNQLSSQVQNQLNYNEFKETLQTIKKRTGPIQYWSYSTPNPIYPTVIVAFQNNLAPGLITWQYENTKFKSFIINDYSQPSFLEFIMNNPKRTAMTIIADDYPLLKYHGNRFQDLMSVFKIPIAIEFSRQVSQGLIDPDKWISIKELSKFYIEGFDISHQLFLENWENMGKIQDGKVKLIEIANGMIALSSNANTEFLQTLLTLELIQKTINKLKLKQTTSYYLNSFLLSYINNKNLTRDQYIREIKSYTEESIKQKSNEIHNLLIQNGQEAQDLLKRGKELLDGEILSIQAQLFTKSTTNSYAQMLNKLNKQTIFDQQFYKVFYPLIGYVSLQNPALANIYKHVGIKAGSSAYYEQKECVLSLAYFYELKKKNSFNKVSIALFTENLDYETEYVPLISQFNYFTGLLGLNEDYLQAIANQLQSKSSNKKQQ
ncbi:unnamed protein product [Paramecium pentaurelia]|uniref:Beta-lactamase class A catalytic domain-containing protein n=1 Tax=Paramecium pentaurelia TaxID=43138 RepID=A0A8S1ULJ1_9CILI|nr:unnamed protein product [Paramecium pentaurelia]